MGPSGRRARARATVHVEAQTRARRHRDAAIAGRGAGTFVVWDAVPGPCDTGKHGRHCFGVAGFL
jgi:hypothetical protein